MFLLTALHEQSYCQRTSQLARNLFLPTLEQNGVNCVCLSVLFHFSSGYSCQVSLVVLGQVSGSTRCYLALTTVFVAPKSRTIFKTQVDSVDRIDFLLLQLRECYLKGLIWRFSKYCDFSKSECLLPSRFLYLVSLLAVSLRNSF